MKKYLFACLALAIIIIGGQACTKKKIPIPGVELIGNKTIYAFNEADPSYNQALEVAESGGTYTAIIMILLGPTSTWGGWSFTKGEKGYSISPKDFPTQALDYSRLNGAGKNVPNMSTYTSGDNFEFTFETAGAPNVYYIKSHDGKYLAFDNQIGMTVFTDAKPAESVSKICRFKIQ